MGLCSSKQRQDLPEILIFQGAGCAFTDGRHILAGYQPQKKTPGISGFGGHREGEESYLETAYRETVEEMFHVSGTQIPATLLPTLRTRMVPQEVKVLNGYILVVFSLQDLHTFLKICKRSGLRSPLYSRMPTTLLDVIQSRGGSVSAELSSLCLLPVVHHEGKASSFVKPEFVKDLRLFQAHKETS